MALLNLEIVKDNLKITHADEDRTIEIKVRQATALVLHYLRLTNDVSPVTDLLDVEIATLGDVEATIVQAAILEVATHLDRFRGDDEKGVNPADEGWMTPSLRGILLPLRNELVIA